jgi:hypothetical protein
LKHLTKLSYNTNDVQNALGNLQDPDYGWNTLLQQKELTSWLEVLQQRQTKTPLQQ